MKRPACILLLIMLSAHLPDAQAQLPLEGVRSKFKDFAYEQVIALCDSLLRQPGRPQPEIIELLEMRAISQYSLGDVQASMQTWQVLLAQAPGHSLDPGRTSPKIVAFFEQIKGRYRPELAEVGPIIEIRVDTLRLLSFDHRPLRGAMARSLLVLGWGQWHLGKPKGRWLAAAGLLTLGAGIYAHVDCLNKETAYLQESDAALMEEKYRRYNIAYRRRTTLVSTYAALWLFSQLDLLWFDPPDATTHLQTSLLPAGHSPGLTVSCRLHF